VVPIERGEIRRDDQANSEPECSGTRNLGYAAAFRRICHSREGFAPSRNHRSGTLHKQSFDPLEPEAGVTRTLVDFDPRRAHFA